MNDRRKFLVNVSSGAAGLLATGFAAGAVAAAAKGKSMHRRAIQYLSPDELLGPSQFPEVTVESSDGKTVKLYADLIKGKVVLINYMAINNEKAFPITTELLEIARRLGPKLGAEVHMISITSDPEHDTPARLRAFAKRMGVPKQGWHFVRMSGKNSAIVSARLYRHPMPPDPHTRLGVINYGNETVGLWGLFPMGISPEDAAMRIASVMSGKPISGPMRRAGPRKLDEIGQAFNNRIA